MKKNLLILAVLAAAAFAVTGCSKPAAAGQSAEPTAKSTVNTAAPATHNADYFGG